jgi:AcrR family transcriptional regulator
MARPSSAQERDLLCAALTALVAEQGYRRLTVERLLQRACLDRSTFDRNFADLEDCFAAVWERADAELDRRLASAYEEAGGVWPRRLRAALAALIDYLEADPARARLYAVDVMQVSERLRLRREAAQERLAELIDRGREAAPNSVPENIAEAVAGAIWHRLEGRLRRNGARGLVEELPLMVYFAVLPFCGSEVASAELRRPTSG